MNLNLVVTQPGQAAIEISNLAVGIDTISIIDSFSSHAVYSGLISQAPSPLIVTASPNSLGQVELSVTATSSTNNTISDSGVFLKDTFAPFSPVNDVKSSAIQINTESGSLNGTTLYAKTFGDSNNYYNLWYKFVAPKNGRYYFTVLGENSYVGSIQGSNVSYDSSSSVSTLNNSSGQPYLASKKRACNLVSGQICYVEIFSAFTVGQSVLNNAIPWGSFSLSWSFTGDPDIFLLVGAGGSVPNNLRCLNTQGQNVLDISALDVRDGGVLNTNFTHSPDGRYLAYSTGVPNVFNSSQIVIFDRQTQTSNFLSYSINASVVGLSNEQGFWAEKVANGNSNWVLMSWSGEERSSISAVDGNVLSSSYFLLSFSGVISGNVARYVLDSSLGAPLREFLFPNTYTILSASSDGSVLLVLDSSGGFKFVFPSLGDLIQNTTLSLLSEKIKDEQGNAFTSFDFSNNYWSKDLFAWSSSHLYLIAKNSSGSQILKISLGVSPVITNRSVYAPVPSNDEYWSPPFAKIPFTSLGLSVNKNVLWVGRSYYFGYGSGGWMSNRTTVERRNTTDLTLIDTFPYSTDSLNPVIVGTNPHSWYFLLPYNNNSSSGGGSNNTTETSTALQTSLEEYCVRIG